jgi:CheY-like chemotaxis protein
MMNNSPTPFDMPSLEPASDTRHLHILVAEDNTINQRLITLLLTKMGHTVDVVENGARAVDAIGTSRYDIAFIDVQMPVMGGLEAAAEICRLHTRDSRPPLVALTANALVGDREKCLAAGMDGYLTKPLRTASLAEMLQQLVHTTGKSGPG